jgi:pyruvate/2-oxoglutarate dehydrogenase complex dihydrolipoamide acyltransferase (E2) component
MVRQANFLLSWLPRSRWNVLDMITFVGVGSIRSCILAEIDMTWAESLRKLMSEQGRKTTITALLIKAVGVAQRAHPDSRAMCLPFGKCAIFQNITAGFTVEKLVKNQPVVFFGTIDSPDTKSLQEITDELGQYAQLSIDDLPVLARQERFVGLHWLVRRLILWLGLRLPPLRLAVNPATFGLTSLGKFGIQSVVSPCSCTSTFGVGSVEERAVVRDNEVVGRPMMTLSYTFDQRIMDELPAARFLNDIRSLLEGRLQEHLLDS